MDAAAVLTPATDAPKAYAKPYGWDRTPYSPDEFRDIRDSGYIPDGPPMDDFTFDDFLSIFNPLQQIPGVSAVYRAATGEKIHPFARLIGGALLGGPVGLIGAFFNNVVEAVSGKDLAETAIAAVFPGSEKPAAAAQEPAVTAAAKPHRSFGDRLAAIFGFGNDDAPATAIAAAPAAAVPAPVAAPADAIQAAAPAAGPQVRAANRTGRALADYQARAIDGPSTMAIGRATVRQNTPSLRVSPAAAPLIAAAPQPAPAAEATSEAKAATTLNDAAVNTWFSERMLMGLDLYRTSKRNPAKAQIDRLE